MRIWILIIFTIFLVNSRLAFSISDTSIQIRGDTIISLEDIPNLSSLYDKHRNDIEPDSTYKYALLLIESYEKRHDTVGVLDCYHKTSDYLIKLQQYKLASNLLTNYIEYAEAYEKPKHIAKAYFLTANFLASADINFEIATEYYNKAIKIFENTKNEYDLALVYHNLGVYSEEDSALEYLFKCAEICKRNDFYNLHYLTYRKLGEIYRHHYKDYITGRSYYAKGLDLALAHNDTMIISDAYIELGCIDMQYDKTDSILYYYNMGLTLARQARLNSKLDYAYRHLAWNSEKNEDYAGALFYMEKVLDRVIDISGSVISEPLLKKAELEQKLGNYNRAANYYQNYIALKDSLDEVRRVQEFSKLELKFDLENIEKENEQKILAEEEKAMAAIQKQKMARNFFILIVVFLCLVVILIYRNYFQKQKISRKLHLANEKLHENDRMKLRFFTNISHELRTPLTLLISPLEQMLSKKKEENELITMMLRNGKKLKSLINQLLDISKIDSDKLSLTTGLHDFNHEFVINTSMFSSLAEEKQIDFRVQPESQEIVFAFDKERMEHVISNLLSNAFKHTPTGGKISADLKRMNKHLQISIKDSGIGIPAEDIEHVFTRFYQSSLSISSNLEGTGLGLTIVKEYVEMHGGTVSVISEPGHGSEFLVTLPCKIHEQDENRTSGNNEHAIVSRISGEETHATKNIWETILIVEDNRDLRGYLKSIFQINYKVLEAVNGEEGKQTAMKENPDIVISDVMMPVCDGYCFTDYLKTQIETSHIPVILLTAKATQDDKITGLRQGADDYILKPFNEQELVLKVQNLLRTKRMQREKYKKSITINPLDVAATSMDEQFLINLTRLVEANMANSAYTVEQLYSEAGMSQRNLYRKIKALTDMNPSEFIRSIRLKRAAQLLSQKSGSVSEIAFQTGFENPSYFTKCFKESFNKLPSEYK